MLLSLLLYLPAAALACIPMKTPQPGIPVQMPGGMPPKMCPTTPPRLAPKDFPTVPTNPLEVYSELPGPTVNPNGETVYKCMSNMYSSLPVDGAQKSANWELICLKKLGHFVVREGNVIREIPTDAKFACFEKPCAVMKDVESSVTPMYPYTPGGAIFPILIGDYEYSTCPAGSALYAMWTAMPSLRVVPGIGPRCKTSVGTWIGAAGVGYSCLKKACMPVTVAIDNIEYCPAAPVVCDNTQIDNGAALVACMDAMFTVKYADPAAPGNPKSTTMLTCDSETGKWKSDDGSLVEMPQVTCGRNI